MLLDREPTAEVAAAPDVDYDDLVSALRPGEAAKILENWERSGLNIGSLSAFFVVPLPGESIPPAPTPS
jgi:hypothetical protein